MATEAVRIYWDSCVYISCIQGIKSKAPEEAARTPLLRQIVKLAEAGEIVLVFSPMIIAEVTKLKGRSDIPLTDQAQLIADFFKNDYLEPRQLDRVTAEYAAEIGRNFGIKPGDAIHLATAIRAKCRVFHTYDGEDGDKRKLLAFDGKIGPTPLAIQKPSIPKLPSDLPLPGFTDPA